MSLDFDIPTQWRDFPLHRQVRERLELWHSNCPQSQIWVGDPDWGTHEILKGWLVAQCPSATKVPTVSQLEQGLVADYRFLNAGKDEPIRLEEVKDFQNWTQLRSVEGNPRFGVIFYAENLSRQGQNSLLKVFEEVPKGLTLILVTAQPERLMNTIRSRAQFLRFLVPTPSDLENFLEKSGRSEQSHQLNDLFFRWGYQWKWCFALPPEDFFNDREIILKEILGWFSLTRPQFAMEFQEKLNLPSWRQSVLDQMEALSYCWMDLWKYQTLNGPVALHFSQFQSIYEGVHHLAPSKPWLLFAQIAENLLSERSRNFNEQLQLEAYFYNLFLKEEINYGNNPNGA